MPKLRRKQNPLRIPPEGTQAVNQLANACGWTTNEALGFLVQAGWNALNGGSEKIPALRRVMTAAVAHHETELATRRGLALSARKLRDARSALNHKQGGVS